MKTHQIIILALLSVFALTGCEQIMDLISNGDGLNSSNLSGSWDIYQVTQTSYENGVQTSNDVQNDLGTISFNTAGTGSYSMTSEGTTRSGSFNWIEDDDKVYLNMINLSDSLMTDNMAIVFDVTTNTSTEQVWEATVTIMGEDTNDAGQDITLLTRNDFIVELRKQ